MWKLMYTIFQTILEITIELLIKKHFPKLSLSLINKSIRFGKGPDPMKLSKQKRLELRIKYIQTLIQSMSGFMVGMLSYFMVSQNHFLLNDIYIFIMHIISALLIFFSLIRFIESIYIRKKNEKSSFWW
jgi:hypothetical protein